VAFGEIVDVFLLFCTSVYFCAFNKRRDATCNVSIRLLKGKEVKKKKLFLREFAFKRHSAASVACRIISTLKQTLGRLNR
jgi:hypothetical protein